MTKLTNYTRIKAILDSGHWAKVTILNGYNKGRVGIFMSIRDNGSMFGTKFGLSVSEAFDGSGVGIGFCKKELNESEISITPYPRKPPVLEVGDKVKVLEIARELDVAYSTAHSYSEDYDATVYQAPTNRMTINKIIDRGIILNVVSLYDGYGCTYHFNFEYDGEVYQIDLPYWAVCKVWEDDEEAVPKLQFGDYVDIEQKRYGVDNEFYRHKVIGTLKSNHWVDVPVQEPRTEVSHKGVVDVVACIVEGISEISVLNYRVLDVKEVK
jgi:hypothetical protein